MKNFKKLVVLSFCALAIMVTYGCTEEAILNSFGNCFDEDWAEGYADELQAWSNAAAEYSENQSAENCTDYKNAARAYLDAIDNVYDCIPNSSRAEIDQEINEARAEIDRESCD